MTNQIKIMASFSGYTGSAITLLAVYDVATNLLTVAKPAKWRDRPDAGFVMLSNLDLPDVTAKFDESKLYEAITAFFRRQAMGNISIAEAAVRYAPDSKVQRLAIKETGSQFEVAGEVDNGTMAVLAMCHYVEGQSLIGSVLDCMDEAMDTADPGLPFSI